MSKDARRQLWSALTFVSSAGFTLVSNIAVGYFIGKWVDAKFSSEPIIAMIGIIFGMITGVWSIYKWILREFLKG